MSKNVLGGQQEITDIPAVTETTDIQSSVFATLDRVCNLLSKEIADLEPLRGNGVAMLRSHLGFLLAHTKNAISEIKINPERK